MFLRRCLLPPGDPEVATNRHRAALPLLGSDAISSASPKPPNPLGLNPVVSVGYPRIDPLQTHCAYLASFQQVIVKKRPLFRKRAMVPVFVVSKSDGRRLQAMRAQSISRGRVAVGKQSMYTNEAGTWPEIRSLPGKIGKGRRSLSEKFGSAPRLHVTVPPSNVRFRPRGAGRALLTTDRFIPFAPGSPVVYSTIQAQKRDPAWGSVQAEV